MDISDEISSEISDIKLDIEYQMRYQMTLSLSLTQPLVLWISLPAEFCTWDLHHWHTPWQSTGDPEKKLLALLTTRYLFNKTTCYFFFPISIWSLKQIKRDNTIFLWVVSFTIFWVFFYFLFIKGYPFFKCIVLSQYKIVCITHVFNFCLGKFQQECISTFSLFLKFGFRFLQKNKNLRNFSLLDKQENCCKIKQLEFI